MTKPSGLITALCAVALIGGTALTRSVHADEHSRCNHVHGTIHSLFTTTGCTSPVGLCTAGTITGGGELDSATTFLALDAAPSAGMSGVEPAANLSYSGVLTVNARRGTLVTHDLGVLDATGLAFTELDRPASGTGVFLNPTNDFFFSGAITDNGTGFTGDIYGVLCTDGGSENW
jgi:hypothetical protein